VLGALRIQFAKCVPEARVILAISGGVDSITLLEGAVLTAPCREALLVAHVNHNLRGQESEDDATLVRSRARELGIAFIETRLEWGTQAASQASCRARRDSFFRSLLTSSADRVWLAHHLNDQAETVFFRLLRGTGARGLRGMLPENGFKVRPFLSLEKTTLVAAARAFNATWREDSSNSDPNAYERNWLRSFFPLLEERRPGFQGKLAALAAEARGWPLPSLRFDSFSAGGGISLHRLPAGKVSTRAFAEQFALGRKPAERLAELVAKASGEWHAEGARFTWSGGVLLREEGARLEAGFKARGTRLVGTLGEWLLPDGARLLESREASGDSRKKEFQSLRVPRFLRAGVPLLNVRGRPRAALPGRVKGLEYTPSALAAWWIGGR
jgi:tRNA(Ile)-lysidine synthetase-like protein